MSCFFNTIFENERLHFEFLTLSKNFWSRALKNSTFFDFLGFLMDFDVYTIKAQGTNQKSRNVWWAEQKMSFAEFVLATPSLIWFVPCVGIIIFVEKLKGFVVSTTVYALMFSIWLQVNFFACKIWWNAHFFLQRSFQYVTNPSRFRR